MREIIVDRENGAKAFVLFELTKGNIAEIKDRYILEQLRSAIDSPWSTALPDGIRSALIRSVSEEMEDRFLLENMDKDTDMSVKSAIRSAAIKVKDQHGVKNGPWTDAYGDADVLDYAYQEIFTRFSDGPGVLLDEIEIPEGYRIISGEKWASDLSGIGREWVDDIKPFLLLADKTGELMICDILSKRTVPVVAVRSDFAERFDRLADEDGMIGDKFWTYACIAEANLQNGRGGINDELGVGIEHWGMYAYIPRVKKDGTPLTDKGGTQKFTRVRAVKENGVWGRYRKGDNGKYEFEQLPSGVHPHPECDRYFKVFNLSLIEGVPPLPVPDLAPNDDIEVGLLADDVIASSRCEVFEGSTDGAYYNFVNDKISVPSREAFNSNSSFLASLLHEMGHSTAPALDRQMTGDMRSKEYAHEEIVAELSSIFSSVDLAVKAETDPEAAGYGEHVAYLEFWKGRLDSVTGTDEYEATKEELCDDFFAAASQASQATDFIIDRYEQEVGHPAAGKEIVQKLDMPEKTEQEDRADRSLSHKKETARDASAHMQDDRADLVNMRDENAIGA